MTQRFEKNPFFSSSLFLALPSSLPLKQENDRSSNFEHLLSYTFERKGESKRALTCVHSRVLLQIYLLLIQVLLLLLNYVLLSAGRFVCVCVCARACVHFLFVRVYICVCATRGEREREKERGKGEKEGAVRERRWVRRKKNKKSTPLL